MKRYLSILLLSTISLSAFAWGAKGHQIVAYIAKKHLTKEAYKAMNDIFDGNSIVYYASWLDEVARDPEYSYTSTWHYVNIDPGQDFEHRESSAYTDGYAALLQVTPTLRSDLSSKAEKQFAAKVIVHVIGDLHQPMHAGGSKDRGGNSIYLNFLDSRVNLHSLWDSKLLNACHDWTYYEWQENLDNLDEEIEAQIMSGELIDWVLETNAIAYDVYKAMPANSYLTQFDVEKWTPTVETQLIKGGLRLAEYLNRIYAGTEGIESVETDTEQTDVIYNLLGIPVDRDTAIPGIYISKSGAKIIVR